MFGLLRKVFEKAISLNPHLDRWVRYRKPRQYWQTRGGAPYFEEQEAVLDRTLRSRFIAEEVHKFSFQSLLEIGCGYGKQLKNLSRSGLFLTGCDFSRPQLMKAGSFFPEIAGRLVEADGEAIPFGDKTFDAVFSSAVILHNKPDKAKKIIAEMIRVSRRYLIHNEDTDITFSRYGYDMKKTYERMNFKVLESKEIPYAQEPWKTQFTVVEIPQGTGRIALAEVMLAYH